MTAMELLSQELSNPGTKVRRDLKLNFKAIADRGALSSTEIGLALIGLGQSLKDAKLREIGLGFVTEGGETLSEEQILEAHESAAIMGMLVLGEPLELRQIAAGCIILIGVFLVTMAPRRVGAA